MTKDKWINIRCTEQERQDITEQAKQNNMSVAEFFCCLVAKERKEREEGEGEMREELKNCPFCNGKAKVKVCDGSGSFCADIGTERFMGREMSHCLILCEKCGVKTKAYLTRRGVYNAWQRRTPQNDEVRE